LKAPNTRKTVRRALNLFERLARPGGLASLDARTIARFQTAMMAEGYAPRSIKTYLDSLHGALAWAVDPGGLIPTVPSFPDVIVPPQRPRPLPAEHYEHLLERAGQLHPLLELGWHAGLRIGEAARLCWEETGREPWVDLEAKRLRFPVGGQKAKREDWIPIAPPLLAVLEALPREGRRVVPLFRQDGSPVKDSYRTDYTDKRFRELARGAGVRATFHGLRKAFGTRYAARVPAQVLQRLMRHSSIAVTLAYYCDLGDAMIEAVNTSFNSDPADLAKPLENKGSAKAGG
ncbi:MAG TPA: site-specific integrase, partial [Gemmataceae bacterium]|nr:site-specific integrase [Gemmataceae bacterium]